jgi:pyruvate,water dikinase
MVGCLIQIAPSKYEDLMSAYQRIHADIQEVLDKKRAPIEDSSYILPLRQAASESVEQVGGKAAGLARAATLLGLPVPDGFVVTASAYLQFLSHNGLSERILVRLSEAAKQQDGPLRAAAAEIQSWILNAQVPPGMEEIFLKSAEALSGGRSVGLALRSSAAMEDGLFSFAGQYATFLNIPSSEVVQRYKEIAASQYTVEALSYMKHYGLPAEDMTIAVICQRVVPAQVSGVLFTARSSADHGETMLVNAVFGLGRLAVEGKISPDSYLLDRSTGQVIAQTLSAKTARLVPREGGGTDEQAVPENLVSRPCLDAGSLKTLWEWGLKLEKHFGMPQEVEWAMDEDGELYLLQTRALRTLEEQERKKTTPLAAHRLLLEGGLAASPGVGSGPVALIRSEKDLAQFPRGSVLVAPQALPKFVQVMDKAAAIVTDIGGVTGHMAVLAREFKVPTLVDTQMATKTLGQGQEITVDADYQRIYEGQVEELLEESLRKGSRLTDNPTVRKLKQVLKLISPLYLTDPQSDAFSPRSVRTLHDITRFAHEMAIQEMLNLSMREETRHLQAIRIKTALPLNLNVLDLGGGLSEAVMDRKEESSSPDNILSIPFRAMWRGMTYPAISWAGPIGINAKGLLSVMTQAATRPEEDFQDKTLAILSRNYLNFSSRLGYHFSTVDAYCGEARNDNYITFVFQGGAADRIRRQRRARFIGTVLERLGFEVLVKDDRVRAQCRKYSCSMTEEKLEHLGRLMGCYRQLDMAMADDDAVEWYTESFLSGNYSFRREP